MNTYFTSDLHFFHTNVIEFCNRPFKDVEDMNQQLIRRWNDRVKYDDHIWVLGDISFGNEAQTRIVLHQLSGIKHLIVGNHDRKGRSDRLFNRDYKDFFVDSHDYYRLKVDGHKFVLCHFPFYSWERGYINLHGHLHNSASYKNKYNQYDVGVDANLYMPVSVEEAVKAAQKGEKPGGNSKYVT